MIRIESERQVLREGLPVLLSHMEPSSIARFRTACHLAKGDYLKLKDELFAGESVESLYSNIVEFQSGTLD